MTSMLSIVKQRKMILLAGLYITQFLGLGFIVTAVPAIMRKAGAGLDDIAWVYGLGLIWALKFLWSPLVDRFGSQRYGHYRSWLVILQSLLIVSLVVASFFDIAEQMPILPFLFALISFFSASQDIAADALAVTILEPSERGIGNSIQTAGGFIGNMLGGGIVLIAYAKLGWQASLLILAAGTALPLINVLLHKEKPAPADARREKVNYRDLYRFFKRPTISFWLAILFTFPMAVSMAYGLMNPMLVDMGWGLDKIGLATNIMGSLASIIGAFGAGSLVHRIGRKWTMIIANIFSICALLGIWLLTQGHHHEMLVYSSLIIMLMAYGANATLISTMIMDKSNPETAATDYSLQSSLMSLFSHTSAGVALYTTESVGYSTMVMIAIGIGVFTLTLLFLYRGYDPLVFAPATNASEQVHANQYI